MINHAACGRFSNYFCWRISLLTSHFTAGRFYKTLLGLFFLLEFPDQVAHPDTCYCFVLLCCSLITMYADIFMDQDKDVVPALLVSSPALWTFAHNQAEAHV